MTFELWPVRFDRSGLTEKGRALCIPRQYWRLTSSQPQHGPPGSDWFGALTTVGNCRELKDFLGVVDPSTMQTSCMSILQTSVCWYDYMLKYNRKLTMILWECSLRWFIYELQYLNKAHRLNKVVYASCCWRNSFIRASKVNPRNFFLQSLFPPISWLYV